MNYEDFIASKSQSTAAAGFDVDPSALAHHLFPHQRDLVRWALRRGRAAIFADTGLGKGPMLLEWSRHVVPLGRVLILAPLAVGEQLEREAARFGVDAHYRDADAGEDVTITNYEMLHAFDASAFTGVVLDESSILKAYDGKFRNLIVESFARTPYKLACTATPAPNDYTELGNHSEFLGVKSRVEMLAEYFVHDGGKTQDWRLKGHAEDAFWCWVCTWAAVVKRPSDLGHDDSRFALPPLRFHEHVVSVDHKDAWKEGRLFADDARTLADQRATRRMTLDARVRMAAELAAGNEPALVWCELNDESESLAKAIPGAVEVSGSDDKDAKKDRLLGFAEGRYRVMVSKPKIAGFGMNWQHCARVIFVGASHSYEQTYQAIRRCWRFGQARPVDVHVVRAETEGAIVENFRGKEAAAEKLALEMVSRVRESMQLEVKGASREWNEYRAEKRMKLPKWAGSEA